VKSVGARTALLGVLEAKGIDGKQMGFPVGQAAVLALEDGVEHGAAILETIEQPGATTSAGRDDAGWGWHKFSNASERHEAWLGGALVSTAFSAVFPFVAKWHFVLRGVSHTGARARDWLAFARGQSNLYS